MPVYEYSCSSCNLRFEVRHPVGNSSGQCCPDCNSEAKRVFTPVGVVFKGTGFHTTDYRVEKPEQIDKGAPDAPAAPACGAGCPSCPAAE